MPWVTVWVAAPSGAQPTACPEQSVESLRFEGKQERCGHAEREGVGGDGRGQAVAVDATWMGWLIDD